MCKINVKKDEKVIGNTIIGEPVHGRTVLPGRSFCSPAAPPFPANVPAKASTIKKEYPLPIMETDTEATFFHDTTI